MPQHFLSFKQYAGCVLHIIDSLHWSCSPRVLIDKWIEHPPGVREGSIPIQDSDFFLSHRLIFQTDYCTNIIYQEQTLKLL